MVYPKNMIPFLSLKKQAMSVVRLTSYLTSDPRNSTTLIFTSFGWGSVEDRAISSQSYMTQLHRNLAQQSLSVECTKKRYFNGKCQWHEIIWVCRFGFQHVSWSPRWFLRSPEDLPDLTLFCCDWLCVLWTAVFSSLEDTSDSKSSKPSISSSDLILVLWLRKLLLALCLRKLFSVISSWL